MTTGESWEGYTTSAKEAQTNINLNSGDTIFTTWRPSKESKRFTRSAVKEIK